VIVTLSAFALPWTPPVLAQESRGAISGHVTDSGGGVLQGARIELNPKGVPSVSNTQGDFAIADLAPATYTIKISFVGFSEFTSEVVVTAGQTKHIDAVLEVASTAEQVVVYAERVHGEAEAINRERTAENVLQVLPAEVITSLPNANVADAIGRLPSVTLERDEGEGKYVQIRGTQPSFSNVTIDGVSVASPESGVRQIKLDVIPSDLVESVEISKTLLANQPGDAIGGSVNLRTKTAGERPTLSVFGLGGYTPIVNGRGVSQSGGTVGKRFGSEKRLGVLFGGTYDWNGRGIDDIEPAPTTIQCDPGNCLTPSDNASSFATYNTMDMREYRYNRSRYGFGGSVDYKVSDNSTIYIRGLYSHFDNFGDRWVYTPTINSFTTSPNQGGADGNMSANAQIRRPVQVIGSLSGGGTHAFTTTVVSWELAAGRSYTRDKGYSSTDFGPIDPDSPLNNVQFGFNGSNPYLPKFPVQNGVNVYDTNQYFLQDYNLNNSYSPQVNLSGGASVAKSYNWNGHFGTLEIGGKVRSAHKFNEQNNPYYNANDPGSLPMTHFLGTFYNANYYDGNYTLGPLVDYNKVSAFQNGNQTDFTLDANATHQRNDPNNYNLTELVAAGYLMNSITLGRFRVYAGLRFEGTNLDVTGYTVKVDSAGDWVSTNPVKQSSGYVDVLPSAQVRYAISPESGIRVAFGMGIARPDFGDLPPYVVLNDRKNSISIGNPNLRPTHAKNYDVLYEHYLKPLGMFQAGFFYKDITDPIYSVDTVVQSGTYQGYDQTQPVNGLHARLWGFEVAYQQTLTFLPGVWSALGVAANYSYTASKAYGVPGRSDTPSLQRQAPNTWNLSPTYDRGRVSIRVGMSYNQANIFQYNYQDGAPLGLAGPNGDQYLYSHFQVDAQGRIRLAKGFSVFVYGLNLTNEVFGFYQGGTIYPIQREYYKPTIAGGVRWTLTPEH
jgi:TonB-dependent receptor